MALWDSATAEGTSRQGLTPHQSFNQSTEVQQQDAVQAQQVQELPQQQQQQSVANTGTQGDAGGAELMQQQQPLFMQQHQQQLGGLPQVQQQDQQQQHQQQLSREIPAAEPSVAATTTPAEYPAAAAADAGKAAMSEGDAAASVAAAGHPEGEEPAEALGQVLSGPVPGCQDQPGEPQGEPGPGISGLSGLSGLSMPGSDLPGWSLSLSGGCFGQGLPKQLPDLSGPISGLSGLLSGLSGPGTAPLSGPLFLHSLSETLLGKSGKQPAAIPGSTGAAAAAAAAAAAGASQAGPAAAAAAGGPEGPDGQAVPAANKGGHVQNLSAMMEELMAEIENDAVEDMSGLTPEQQLEQVSCKS